MSHYDSDGSTLVNQEHNQHQHQQHQSSRRSERAGGRRYRSTSSPPNSPVRGEGGRNYNHPRRPSQQSQSYYYDRAYPYANGNPLQQQKSNSSKYATLAKTAVVVGVVGVLLHKWQKERTAQREREERRERHRRRRDFERAKKARRKEEERREREEEEVMEPGSPQQEVRRIEYRPLEAERGSESGSEDDERENGRRKFDENATPMRSGRSSRAGSGGERVYEGDRRGRSRYQD